VPRLEAGAIDGCRAGRPSHDLVANGAAHSRGEQLCGLSADEQAAFRLLKGGEVRLGLELDDGAEILSVGEQRRDVAIIQLEKCFKHQAGEDAGATLTVHQSASADELKLTWDGQPTIDLTTNGYAYQITLGGHAEGQFGIAFVASDVTGDVRINTSDKFQVSSFRKKLYRFATVLRREYRDNVRQNAMPCERLRNAA
jgi:hypothetical protein